MGNRVLLVTDAISEVGWDVALELASRGERVFGGMRSPSGRNRGAADRMRALAVARRLPLSVIQLDVTSPESVDAAVSEIADHCGRVDVLINNAQIGFVGPWELATAEQSRLVFETNVLGAVRSARAVVPYMRAQGAGWIVNVVWETGLVPVPLGAYDSASTMALAGLTQVMRLELAQFGIRVVQLVLGTGLRRGYGGAPAPVTVAPGDARPYDALLEHMARAGASDSTSVSPVEIGIAVAAILDDPDPPGRVCAWTADWWTRTRTASEGATDVVERFELSGFMAGGAPTEGVTR